MHDVIVVGVPLLATLGGFLFNNHALDLVRHELKETKKELRAEIKFEIKEIRGEIKKIGGESRICSSR